MPEITLRNAHRAERPSGYGRFNAGLLAKVADSADNPDAEIQLFCSPSYNFEPVPGRFNVGVTACDRALHLYEQFDFVAGCNRMDLLVVPAAWDRLRFLAGGVRPPILMIAPGFDAAPWLQPVRDRTNRQVFMLDRGRDEQFDLNMVRRYFYTECVRSGKTPGDEIDAERLRQHYWEADIFLKWAREGSWSYPALEALAAGCLLVTNCPYLFVTAENSLWFETEAELQSVLARCKRESLLELKRAGQQTAQTYAWALRGPVYRRAIIEAYHQYKG